MCLGGDCRAGGGCRDWRLPACIQARYWRSSYAYRPENIERHEEKESGSVEIKLKRHLVIEFRLIKGVEDSFRAIAIAVWLSQQNQGLSYPAHSKE